MPADTEPDGSISEPLTKMRPTDNSLIEQSGCGAWGMTGVSGRAELTLWWYETCIVKMLEFALRIRYFSRFDLR